MLHRLRDQDSATADLVTGGAPPSSTQCVKFGARDANGDPVYLTGDALSTITLNASTATPLVVAFGDGSDSNGRKVIDTKIVSNMTLTDTWLPEVEYAVVLEKTSAGAAPALRVMPRWFTVKRQMPTTVHGQSVNGLLTPAHFSTKGLSPYDATKTAVMSSSAALYWGTQLWHGMQAQPFVCGRAPYVNYMMLTRKSYVGPTSWYCDLIYDFGAAVAVNAVTWSWPYRHSGTTYSTSYSQFGPTYVYIQGSNTLPFIDPPGGSSLASGAYIPNIAGNGIAVPGGGSYRYYRFFVTQLYGSIASQPYAMVADLKFFSGNLTGDEFDPVDNVMTDVDGNQVYRVYIGTFRTDAASHISLIYQTAIGTRHEDSAWTAIATKGNYVFRHNLGALPEKGYLILCNYEDDIMRPIHFGLLSYPSYGCGVTAVTPWEVYIQTAYSYIWRSVSTGQGISQARVRTVLERGW